MLIKKVVYIVTIVRQIYSGMWSSAVQWICLSVTRYHCSRKLSYLQDVLCCSSYCSAPISAVGQSEEQQACPHMKRNASRTLRNCFFDFIRTKFGKIKCCSPQECVSLLNVSDICGSTVTAIPFHYVFDSNSVRNSGKYTNVTTTNA
jgi:hypothetical protein